MKKRFLRFLATFSIVEAIGRHPALATLLLLGVGGVGAAILNTPSITPQPSAYFNQMNVYNANNVLQPNGATGGALYMPNTTPSNSFAVYVEGTVDSNLNNGSSPEYALGTGSGGRGLYVTRNGAGMPVFVTQTNYDGLGGVQWWNAISPITSTNNTGASSNAGSNYLNGYYQWRATGGSCAREPSGVFTTLPAAKAWMVDPGFLCQSTPVVSSLVTIPGIGAQQNTGAGSIATTCSGSSPVSGEMTVTAYVAVAHGLVPGQTYALAGFTPSGYNATYTALPGTTGTTLVGATTTGGGTCPAAVSIEGHALPGTGGSITLPAISTTNPYGSNMATGITTQNGQHFCGIVGEYGADSPFPGAQFVAMVDRNGNSLPGSPALVPWLNQGAVTFTGYTVAGTQSPSTPALNVTAMQSTNVSTASYSGGTGYVTFTMASSPNLVPGSEFTVSGVSPSGYNQTYVAVAGTSGTNVVGNPLSGPVGTPQAIAAPSSYVSGGSMVGVIMPGMQVFGDTGSAVISPFGTFGGTGTGGTGSYALVANQTTYTFTASFSGKTMTVTGTPGAQLAIGEALTASTGTGTFVGTTITGYGTGTGGAGTYTVANSQTVTSGTVTAAGTIGSAGSTVQMFAWPAFYYSAIATASQSSTIGVLQPRLQSLIGDFASVFGSANNTVANTGLGWGGDLANIGMFHGVFPQTSGGAPDTTKIASLCTKATDPNTFASANSLTLRSLYRLNDPGIWADSGAAQFTGSISGTALTIASTQTGSTSALANGTVIAGAGITGCPSACPTISSGSASSYTLNPSGGTVSTEAMTAGAYKPASSTIMNQFNGYIAGNTLTVTSLPSTATASFTGSTTVPTAPITSARIDNGTIGQAGNILTVATITGTPLTAGNTITGTGIAAGTVITALGSGVGGAGTYYLNNSQNIAAEAMTASTVGPSVGLTGLPTTLTVSGVTGTIKAGMVVTDGGASITGPPLVITGGSGSNWTINPNYYPLITSDATMVGTLTAVVPGQYVQQTGITTPIKVLSYGTGTGGVGTYTILNPAGLTVGSVGSPVTFTSITVEDGAAVAPGPALTITDKGPGIVYPVTNYGSSTGTVWIAGTYDTSALGGTPTSIQTQISNTAGGPPISGCSACAWTNLTNYTSALSSGSVYNWSGQAVSVPAGGPYYITVRAANGTAYATMTDQFKVGLTFDWWGEGQTGNIDSNASGTALSNYVGLWGRNAFTDYTMYKEGPNVVGAFKPSRATVTDGNTVGVTGGTSPILPEAVGVYEQNLQNAFGWPASMSDWVRNGIGVSVFAIGGTLQTQTIAVGDGSKTTWCSASTFCSNVSAVGTLEYTAAGMTGATFTGAISGTTLTVDVSNGSTTAPPTAGVLQGSLEPGMSLNFSGISGSATLVACTSNCTPTGGSGGTHRYWSNSVWTISSSQSAASGTKITATPPGGTLWPYNDIQSATVPILGTSSFGTQTIKAGTFSVAVNGVTVCTDNTTFSWNVMAGNCTGAGISSSFVNYVTGDYQITFGSPPSNGAAITASWTNIVSSDAVTGLTSVAQNLDYTGDGTATSGALSSMLNKSPGGTSGHVFAGCSGDSYVFNYQNYALGAVGYTQEVSWLYGTKIPSIMPWVSASTPFVSANYWRGQGPSDFALRRGDTPATLGCEQWGEDVATSSTFSGTVGSIGGSAGAWTAVLTLSGAATGPMWEGEVVGCNPFSTSCAVPAGAYIASLASGTWGANGSTYNLLNANPGPTQPFSTIGSPLAMANAAHYQGAGPAIYIGPNNDADVLAPPGGLNGVDGYSPHSGPNFTGGRRIGARWAALTWGGLTTASNASDPTLDRVKANASGCDVAALAAPCFDIGSTYSASATATWTGKTATVTGGLLAHARPFVVGQALTCSGCNSNLVITSIDVPPTQSTTAGAGEVGQTFHITASGTIGGSGSGTVTGGCSGTSGTGSNCIDIAIAINTGGSYGTPAALATCGENNLNGSAADWDYPTGVCSNNGIGSLVRDFRIGTTQLMGNYYALATGSVYDDGVDPMGGSFTQSSAFTCNIVAAKVIQCVKGAAYSSGVFSSIGQWASGSTYIQYGDPILGTGRQGSLLGNVGGQPFGLTAGSGYTNGTYTIGASGCTTSTGSFIPPRVDVTISGGALVNVYGSAIAGTATVNGAGYGVGYNCTFPFGSTITGTVSGANLSVTAVSAGGLAAGQTVVGVSPSRTLVACTANCLGSNQKFPASQTWSMSGSATGTPTGTNYGMGSSAFDGGSGTGGAVTVPTVKPVDGAYGIANFNSDSNMMGDLLYDNSGFVGNPLNSFFTNGQGGYFEPGLPVHPFGIVTGVTVSG
jgi:hypothetical protein